MWGVTGGYRLSQPAPAGWDPLIPQLRCSDYCAATKKPVKSVIKAETMRAGSSHFGSGSKHKVMHLYAPVQTQGQYGLPGMTLRPQNHKDAISNWKPPSISRAEARTHSGPHRKDRNHRARLRGPAAGAALQ